MEDGLLASPIAIQVAAGEPERGVRPGALGRLRRPRRVELARHHGRSRRTAREISAVTEVPPQYLPQILASLVRSGFLVATAGQGGGYELARPPAQITLLEVVEAIEGPFRSNVCVLRGGPCDWDRVCPVHIPWTATERAFREQLGATACDLRVGYADRGLARNLRDRGLSLDAAQRLGLFAGDRDTLAGRIVVPDIDATGRATWLTARSLDGREPRYLNLRLPSPLLGLAQVVAAGVRAVVVTEGPGDWLTACGWQLRAIALLGTHVSRDVLSALRAFKRVYLALDADGPGRRATARLVSELGARAVVVPFPSGVHDLNELGCRRHGREAFLRSLLEARARRRDSWQSQTDSEPRARAA